VLIGSNGSTGTIDKRTGTHRTARMDETEGVQAIRRTVPKVWSHSGSASSTSSDDPGCVILKNFRVHANTMFRLPMNWKIRTPVSHRCTLKEGAPSSGELYEKVWLLCCPQSLFGLPVRDQLPAILEKHPRRVPISSATWWALCTMARSALQAEAKRTMENGLDQFS
jgi:hypothetical protein